MSHRLAFFRPEDSPSAGGRNHVGGLQNEKAGLAARLTKEWALADISFTGLTMTAMGTKFIGYAAFDTPADANKAATILAQIGTEAKAKELETNGKEAVLV